MQNSKLNYTIVGVFVIAMLATAISAAIALSGRGGSYDSYVVRFDNIADVKFGTLVRYEGFPVGQVEEIRPVAQGGGMRFDLDVSVSQGWRIPDDSVAHIGSSTFLGAKTVEIRRGKSVTPLKPGTQIASVPSTDMFAAMSSIAGDFGDLSKNSLRPLVGQIVKLVASADTLMEKDLGKFLGSLNRLTGDLQNQVPQIARDMQSFTHKLNNTMSTLQTVLSKQNVDGVENVVRNVEQASHEFVQVSINLQGTLDQVNGVVADLGKIIDSNETKVGAALDDTRYVLRSMARNIDAINHNLAGTTRNMNEFSRLIRQNPGLLLGGSPREEVNVKAKASSPSLSQRPSE
ncbi:MAG: MlaD family protein [Alphaproteobacteria bacterium]